MLGAGLGIGLSLLIVGLGFYIIFQRHIVRAAITELENHFTQLAASIRVDNTGTLKARTSLSDPRFQKPYGGLYWQINEAGHLPLRSRSLFDDSLPVPPIPKLNDASPKSVHIIDGPESTSLIALEKDVIVQPESGIERKIQVTMAIDRHDINQTVSSFGYDLLRGLGLLSGTLLAGAFFQIYVGLRPLEAIRRGVEAIRLGTARNIGGSFPKEVELLVAEVNDLLAERENQLTRARQRASNLAHGLKTPLTIMAAVADSVEASGLTHDAKDIRESADQMRMLVERELARARMASGFATQLTALAPIVARIVNALKKTSDNETLLWHSNVPADAVIAMEPGDLLECVGNLLENARKWAKSQIYISWRDGVLKIEDDGPGVPVEKIPMILERGVRLDESVAGSGLGLGIVREMVEIYGFELKLERSSLGGLSVSLGARH
jgi:signal transduction histidine kinase